YKRILPIPQNISVLPTKRWKDAVYTIQRTWTIPPLSDDEVLLKDHHIVHGGFGELAGFPLVPGHEIVGYVLKKGKNVQDFSEGDRCVVDPITRCHKGLGVNTQGGFANHVVV
ncbi:hypothetical protein MPER_00352, partial [Moniliophthora perniciosa FA553]